MCDGAAISDLLISLVGFAVIATITPGGATTLATASGAQFGFVRSIPLLAGIAFGLASLVGAIGGGLGTVTLPWPQLQFWLRIVGSAYLLCLAWWIGRLGAPPTKAGGPTAPMGFATGILLLWLNPKGWTMAFAAATAYNGLSDSPEILALVLATVFGLAATISLSIWCTGGLWFSQVLRTEKQWRAVNIALGLLLAASIAPMWL